MTPEDRIAELERVVVSLTDKIEQTDHALIILLNTVQHLLPKNLEFKGDLGVKVRPRHVEFFKRLGG